jgi:hypothetical protein
VDDLRIQTKVIKQTNFVIKISNFSEAFNPLKNEKIYFTPSGNNDFCESACPEI